MIWFEVCERTARPFRVCTFIKGWKLYAWLDHRVKSGTTFIFACFSCPDLAQYSLDKRHQRREIADVYSGHNSMYLVQTLVNVLV